jgi:hypothetical protein
MWGCWIILMDPPSRLGTSLTLISAQYLSTRKPRQSSRCDNKASSRESNSPALRVRNLKSTDDRVEEGVESMDRLLWA